jgi:hypothetical protein
MKLVKRARNEPFPDFCDRCGAVCGTACKHGAILGAARDRALLVGAEW